MNEALEFHDSVVGHVVASMDAVVIHFAKAYIHRSSGEPGVSPGEGFTQAAELAFDGATWSGSLEQAHGAISDAHVTYSGREYHMLLVPFSTSGQIAATIVFASGASLKITAKSAKLSLHGKARFVERYAG
jgi:hypothetical protein